MSQYFEALEKGEAVDLPAPAQLTRFREAVLWAQGMPPAGEMSFIANSVLIRDDSTFTIPSILSSDSTGPITWRHLPVDMELTSKEDSVGHTPNWPGIKRIWPRSMSP